MRLSHPHYLNSYIGIVIIYMVNFVVRITYVVAEELSCHWIALVEAISYMSNTRHSEATYVSRLRRYGEPLLNDPATNRVDM